MVRSTTCITFCFLVLLFTNCGTILSGKKQKVVFTTPTASPIQITIWEPKPDQIFNEDSVQFANGEYLKINEFLLDSGSTDVSVHRPKPKQIITFTAINPNSTGQKTSPAKNDLEKVMASNTRIEVNHFKYYSPTFNESALLNFVIPWNWMIDAYTGAVLRWKITNPIAPPQKSTPKPNP